MVYCHNCNSWNNDNNKFCGNCGTKLKEPENYCPYCDITFHGGENFCTECGTKLIAKSQHIMSTSTRPSHFRDKPADARSYNIRYSVDKKDSVVSIDYSSPDAEFAGKTQEELEMELRFVTNKYEDCKKTGDYMTTYYKDKKEILERLLGIL